MSRELPIIFNTEMTEALLDSRKTQTRRPLKFQPATFNQERYEPLIMSPNESGCNNTAAFLHNKHGDHKGHLQRYWNKWTVDCDPSEDSDRYRYSVKSPYQIGDILYVRETWQYYDWSEDGDPCIKYKAGGHMKYHLIEDEETAIKIQETVWPYLSREENYTKNNRACDYKWRPSIHMPKWAARIHLRVTNVRIERVQDISKKDAIAEGVYTEQMCADAGLTWMFKPRRQFLDIWKKIYGTVNENPYVWVYDFEVTK